MSYKISYRMQLAPSEVPDLLARGRVAWQTGALDTAKTLFERVLKLNPNELDGLQMLGAVAMKLQDYALAASCFHSVTRLVPGFAEAYNNHGRALGSMGSYGLALQSFDQAIALYPDYVQAHYSRGVVLEALCRCDSAISAYEHTLALDPTLEEARWNLGICQLLSGNFKDGWPNFERRWDNASFALLQMKRLFSQPQWLGNFSLKGKTLLVHSEQGLGDTVQFCRYVPMLVELGATVVLEAQPPLISVLGSLQGVKHLVARGDPLPPFDCHSPLLSLPLAFNTTLESVPAPGRYLRSDPDAASYWISKLPPGRKPRVGLVWQGSRTHARDADRSIALSSFSSLFDVDANFISLQRETTKDDENLLTTFPNVTQLGQDLHDFTDTAALCDLMDLVICVDTSVAHLMGALGNPVWILLSFVPDWRWMLDRDDSPWYPTARLFRQPALDDWNGALSRVRFELAAVCANHIPD
jgi:tetratricopeptide (TPR) repeat protein